MLVIVGIVVVIVAVLGGFTMAGGPILLLFQISEIVVIVGTAAGSLLISSPVDLLKKMVAGIAALMKPDPYTKEQYLNLLKTMFELFNIATREGLINIEAHVGAPTKSTIFQKNAFLVSNHHALAFFADTLKLLLGGGVPPHDLEAMLEADLDTHHHDTSTPPSLLQKTADALPGIGIVAAVLGIIITMQSIGAGAEAVGHHVAAALVGTFLGVLLSYGFVNPLATHLDLKGQAESRYFECIKAGVVAFAKGTSPSLTVEFARRVIPGDIRPTFEEVEQAVRQIKAQSSK